MQDIQQYGAWRERVAEALEEYRGALVAAELADAASEQRLAHALARVRDDRLSVAFVAEFSRGKSELINAIFFADYGQRSCRPASGCCRSTPAPGAWPPATTAKTRPPGPCCRWTWNRPSACTRPSSR
jgi:hypothetical protein